MRSSAVLALVALALAAPGAALDGSYDAPSDLPAPEQVYKGGFVVAMEFASDGVLVWADLTGAVKMLAPGSDKAERLHEVPAVRGPEWGVTGLALAPDFTESHDVFLAYTTGPPGVDPSKDDVSGTMRVSHLHDGEETVLFTVEATRSHNSGRLLVHDGLLYFSNGEHTTGSEPMEKRMLAQDPGNVAGKVLRMTLDGKPAPGNPYEKDPNYDPFVYSMGHRNPFGLAWDPVRDRLVLSDPGPDCCEEVNAVEPGGNYGWPVCSGACDPPKPGMTDPLVYYPKVITPVGISAVGKDYYIGSFNTQEVRRLYETDAGWTDEVVAKVEAGLLDVEGSPDGKELYFGTWNGVWKMPTPEASFAGGGPIPPPEETPPEEEPPAEEAPRESLPPPAGRSVPLPALGALAALALAARRRR